MFTNSPLDLIPERIRQRITVADTPHPILGTPCWVCEGYSSRNGYKRAWWQGANRQVHRIVWWILKGDIPEEKPILDHRCRNRACCNPEHLEPVTHRENTLRGEAVLFQPLSAANSVLQCHAV